MTAFLIVYVIGFVLCFYVTAYFKVKDSGRITLQELLMLLLLCSGSWIALLITCYVSGPEIVVYRAKPKVLISPTQEEMKKEESKNEVTPAN